MALAAGKSVKWVAAQLGHADPALTLRVCTLDPSEERDLGFRPDWRCSAHDSAGNLSARDDWHAGRNSGDPPNPGGLSRKTVGTKGAGQAVAQLQDVAANAQCLGIALEKLPVAGAVDARVGEEDTGLHPAHEEERRKPKTPFRVR